MTHALDERRLVLPCVTQRRSALAKPGGVLPVCEQHREGPPLSSHEPGKTADKGRAPLSSSRFGGKVAEVGKCRPTGYAQRAGRLAQMGSAWCTRTP